MKNFTTVLSLCVMISLLVLAVSSRDSINSQIYACMAIILGLVEIRNIQVTTHKTQE